MVMGYCITLCACFVLPALHRCYRLLPRKDSQAELTGLLSNYQKLGRTRLKPKEAVAWRHSLGLVLPGVATDGITLFFLPKNWWPFSPPLESVDLFSYQPPYNPGWYPPGVTPDSNFVLAEFRKKLNSATKNVVGCHPGRPSLVSPLQRGNIAFKK